jgi:hypothetical protein
MINVRRRPSAVSIVERGGESHVARSVVALNLRIPAPLHAEIKEAIAGERVPPSISKWILGAIADKLSG